MIMDHQLILVLLCLIWFNDLNLLESSDKKILQFQTIIALGINYFVYIFHLLYFFFLIWIVNYGIIHDKYYSNFFSNYLHVVPHLRREGNDSLNDETFGSSDSTSEDRAEEERKRRGICFLILEFFCKHQFHVLLQSFALNWSWIWHFYPAGGIKIRDEKQWIRWGCNTSGFR